MSEPKISVIIPVYNAEEFLEDCLNSILNQSFKEIEVICINDGSSDNSLNILNNFQKKDKRIKIYSQTNKGPAFTRNLGLSKAKGEYILFVDSDDWVEQGMFEELYAHAKHLNSDLVLFDAVEYKLDNTSRNRIYFQGNFNEDYKEFTFQYDFCKKLVLNYFNVIWSKMYKREYIKHVKFPDLPLFEDIQFHVESMLLANKISYFPKKFYNYRKMNINSEQNFKVTTDKNLVIVDVFKGIYDFLSENGFYDEFKINYFIFTVSESRNSLNNIGVKYKQKLFNKIKSFFIDFDFDFDIEEVPFDLYQIYAHIMNAENYFEYESFQEISNTKLDENETILLNKIIEKNDIISNYEKQLLEISSNEMIYESFLNYDDINSEAYHKIIEMGLFDEDFYRNHEGYSGKLDPLLHYLYIGYEEGKNPCELFDTNYYLNYYSSVKQCGLNPLVHFVMQGLYEGKVKIREDVWQPPLVLNKFEADAQLNDLSNISLNKEKRFPKLIVSMTSYPERMDIIKYAIFSLFNQTLKPDKIVLWLAKSQFPNEESDIPLDVLKYVEYGLEIKWCDDIKSYKKLIPSLKEFPNDIIVTFDDDIYVEPDLLEKLYSFYLNYPDCIIANRIRKLSLNEDYSIKDYKQWELCENEQNASFLNIFTGSGGVLYPPHSLNEEIFNIPLAKELAPTADDLWFWAMAVKKGTKIKLISGNNIFARLISPEMEIGLFENSKETLWEKNSSGLNNKQMDNILNRFPDIKERIIQSHDEEKLKNSRSNMVLNEIKTNFVPNQKDVKVAAIMDQFTQESYKFECNLINLHPHNWLDTFINEKPDFFFCESAFHGLKTEEHPKGEWLEKICVNLNNDVENRNILFSIIEYCNKNDIPTVFWNKEDPSSFYDYNFNFVDTALHFDYIFTSDEDCIPRYLSRGHKNVNSLMFATQPKLFNPIKTSERSHDVIFAGSWYKKFPERCNVMKLIFEKLLNHGFNLKIYDRMYERHSSYFAYPQYFQQFLNPGVDFNQMPLVYKESNYGLNINTVTESPTMFARRVFELMSSNTIVFSNYSKAVSLLFGDNVVFLDQDVNIDDYDFEKICEENLYNVLENHTYSNRFQQILNTIGIEYEKKPDEIFLIYSLEKEDNIETIINHFNSINYSHKYLKIILSSNYIGELDGLENEIIIKEDLESIFYDSDDKSYFCFTNTNLNKNFIKKALLHFKYLPNDFGVVLTKENSNKFTFGTSDNLQNIVFNSSQFEKLQNQIISGIKCNFDIYYI